MWLLLVALFGFVVPNGFFVYWLLFEFHGLGPVLQDKLALGFILDVLLALIVLSVYFARHPIGPAKWYWFILLSLLGGLGFSLPLYYWLNSRQNTLRKPPSLGTLRGAALIAVVTGAVASLALMFRAGQRAPRFLLALFTLWELGPFAALVAASMVSKRWSHMTQTALYSVMLVVTLGSLAIYLHDAWRPRSAQPYGSWFPQRRGS
jgi:hypothetical protein